VQVYDFTSDDLQDLGEIGRGAFGTVNKMVHRRSNTVMAVKVRIILLAWLTFML
jgi:mitogen-activated protein kinase kinase 4